MAELEHRTGRKEGRREGGDPRPTLCCVVVHHVQNDLNARGVQPPHLRTRRTKGREDARERSESSTVYHHSKKRSAV